MATLILVRHGRSTANTSGLLAGRTPGVHLDEVGRAQAQTVADRLAGITVSRMVSSPLERCLETAEPLAARTGLPVQPEAGLAECDYGAWSGRAIKELLKEPLWRVVQRNPSAAHFPEGESLQQMSARAAAAVRRHDREVGEQQADAVWVAFSHGDLIKSIVADALGLHLDLFQRVHVDPGSISVVRYGEHRPTVLTVNSHEGALDWVAPRPETAEAPAGDAVVGGGSGPTA
ncbi:MSMEG_4193 family putative phosphomutase [Nocardioides daejeonensis]|uniref:MSMEG_4193 family putative phosphomutase n=1 Tax=Nocardioides daejeonensis TaxID=1046556 RepID=UPI000D74357B|nr:MSMEG_4193 family putative phosphomutase [Nocardioides daejeonensis]